MKKLTYLILLIFNLSVLTAQDYKFYALSNDAAVSEPIYLCSLDSSTGAIALIETYGNIKEGSYMAMSPDTNNLIVTSKSQDGSEGGIVQFSIADDGKLTFVEERFKTSDAPCYVSFTKDQEYVLTASWDYDEISMFPITDNVIQSEIDKVTKTDMARAHYISCNPSGKFVHAVFYGLDKVFNYTIEDDKFVTNANQATFDVPTGYSPRHMAFHTTNGCAYLLNQRSSIITVCSYNSNTGVLTQIQEIDMLPDGYTDANDAAAIRIHPNGNFLYASNRGHESIVVYSIAGDGQLTLVEHETEGIVFPRDFNLTHDGTYMVVGNNQGANMISFRIDQTTGELFSTGKSLSISKSLSFEFIPNPPKNEPILSTSEKKNSNDIKPYIFPNPAYLTIHISSNCLFANDVKYQIIDMTGKIVQQDTLENETIDISALHKGIYILNLKTDKKTISNKLLIQ